MERLTEKVIIRLMKEEWDKKLNSILENDTKSDSLSVSPTIGGKKIDAISVGLKVKEKSGDKKIGGLEFTVKKVDDEFITLIRYDNGKAIVRSVPKSKLEDDYERE